MRTSSQVPGINNNPLTFFPEYNAWKNKQRTIEKNCDNTDYARTKFSALKQYSISFQMKDFFMYGSAFHLFSADYCMCRALRLITVDS